MRRRTPPRKRKHWGLRTLGFLTIALVSVLASNVLYARGNADFILLTTAGVAVGLIGAGVCSVRGLRSWSWLERDGPG